jgi:hypothetical protein
MCRKKFWVNKVITINEADEIPKRMLNTNVTSSTCSNWFALNKPYPFVISAMHPSNL